MSADFEYAAEIMDDFDRHVQENVEKSIANEKDSKINEIWNKIFSTKDHYEIIELCGQLAFLSPDNFMVDIKKAQAYGELKQNSKSEEIFKSVIKKTNGDLVEPHLFFGLFLERTEKFQEAINCYDKVTELDGNESHVWFHKGLAWNNLHKYQDAIDCFDKAAELGESGEWQLWDSKSYSLYALDRHQDALDCIDKSIEMDGADDVQVIHHKGIVLTKNLNLSIFP